MPVTSADVRAAVRALGLSHRSLCVHSSLHSFGHVAGGAETIIDGLLAEGCTILVPTGSYGFAVPPPPGQRPARNGWDYERFAGPRTGIGRIYTTATREVDRDMGAIPAAVLRHPDAVRGNHPLASFSAIGPLADRLVASQGPMRVYAPLEQLVEADGWIVLMGVGLNRLTLLHLAEQRAGRQLFRRWANDPAGKPRAVEIGGCSEGFTRFAEVLSAHMLWTTVGQSRWMLLPARATLEAATRAIRADPGMTHCGDPECERCYDAVAGGPIDN
jgi:aminoglycoside N3'-acetyltransferase